MIQFPNICPACQSAARHTIIPTSPEVETSHCDNCGHEWSVPAAPPLRPIPDAALPRKKKSWWRRSTP